LPQGGGRFALQGDIGETCVVEINQFTGVGLEGHPGVQFGDHVTSQQDEIGATLDAALQPGAVELAFNIRDDSWAAWNDTKGIDAGDPQLEPKQKLRIQRNHPASSFATASKTPVYKP
jgi:hypothetical protein